MYKRIGATVVCTALALSLTACGTNDYDRRDNIRNDRMGTLSTQNGNGYINGNVGNDDDYGNNFRNGDKFGDTLNNNNNPNNPNNGTANGNGRYETMSNGDVMNDQQKRLVERVRNVNGVQDATVFVNGKDIIVGLEVDNIGKRNEIEKNVRQALEKDNDGYTVHVTSERTMHDRIRNIHGEMESSNGNTARDFAGDVGDLLRDMGEAVTQPFR